MKWWITAPFGTSVHRGSSFKNSFNENHILTGKLGRDPGIIYNELTKEFGEPVYDRIETKATPEQKEKSKKLSAA